MNQSGLIERSAAWFERYMVPPLGALASNVYLQAVRDAFIIFTLPLVLAGSLFLVVANAPIPALAALLANDKEAILVPYELSFGLMALFLSFGVAYSLAQYRRTEPVQPGILAMVIFLLATVPVIGFDQLTLADLLPYLGGEGLLVAILAGIFSTEIMRFRGSRFSIRLPKTVPSNVKRAFEALIPALCAIFLTWLLEWFVSSYTFSDPSTHAVMHYTVPILLMKVFEPLVVVQDSYPAALLEIMLMMLLWSVGIHGMNVVTAIALPFWLSTIAANASQGAHGIVTEPFFHIFSHLGGSGATWPLVIYMLRSRSSQLRTVGKVALWPAIFNINEPVTFGVPMALNPLMMIPFILVPAVIVTVNYLAFALGLVHVPVVMQPFTVPVGISGFIATGGDFRGSLLQALNLLISAALYYPFFKAWERVLIAREEDAARQEETRLAAQEVRARTTASRSVRV